MRRTTGWFALSEFALNVFEQVCDQKNSRLQIFASDGRFITAFGGFRNPQAVCVDIDGRIVVADSDCVHVLGFFVGDTLTGAKMETESTISISIKESGQRHGCVLCLVSLVLASGSSTTASTSHFGWPLSFASSTNASASFIVPVIEFGGSDIACKLQLSILLIFSVCRTELEELLGADIVEAAEKGDVKQLEACFDRGEDLDEPNCNEYTALIKAAENGHTAAVEFLIAHKANVNYSTRDTGYSALFAAVYDGHTTVCEVLLRAGADKSKKRNWRTPAQLAAERGHQELAAFIDSWGQKLNGLV